MNMRMDTLNTLGLMKCCLAVLAATLGAGCTASTITPMRAMQRVEYVVEVVATQPATSTAPATAAFSATEPAPSTASAPATEPVAITPDAATSTAPTVEPATLAAATTSPTTSTAPATQPTVRVTRIKFVDPNQTTRFVYAARYDRIWEESMALLVHEGYRIDRRDYRAGVLTTIARPAAHFIEAWRSDWVGGKHAAENTINTQRRSVRITVKPVEDKPGFYEIATQVLVERQDNPSELLLAPVFVEGSAFGRNPLTLQADSLNNIPDPSRWRVVGHDIPAEKQILDLLFKRI